MKNEYVPQPVDTAGINLPDEMEALAEKLAKNVHDVWART
ncbi:MAG: RyR domain-containing protein, partial [Muribaculaceae bacterium]